MRKTYWVFLALIFPLSLKAVEAQEAIACAQNAPYWDLWQENFEFRSHMTDSVWNVTSFDISPDGKTLAVTNGDSLVLYDTQTLTPIVQLESPDLIGTDYYVSGYRSISWSPDGHQIAAIYYVGDHPAEPNAANGIQIWDAQQRQQVGLLADPEAVLSDYAYLMAWSPDGTQIAQVTGGGDLSLWDVASGTESMLYEHQSGSGRSTMDVLTWSPDGRYLAGSSYAGGVLSLYTLGKGEAHLETPERDVGYIVWSPDSSQLVIGNQLAWNLFIYDVSTWEITQTLIGSKNGSFDLQWSPDGTRLARGTLLGLLVWDMTSNDVEPTYTFEEQMPPFVRMDWTPDSQFLISVDFEGSLYRWDVETGCVEAASLKAWRPG